jgi:hypothetical protein
MPTGMTTTEGQRILNSALFEHIFSEDIRTLGPAIASAKQTLLANGSIEYEQISATFLLFGDPATVLKVPLPRMPAGVAAQRQSGGVRISWNAALDCNASAVAGYNIYRAGSAAGPFSQVNTARVTGTVYVDTGSGLGIDAAGAAGGSSYYRVTSVDSGGTESVQSLAVKPASLASAGTAGSSMVGCFIETVTNTMPQNVWWLVVVLLVSLAIVKGVRCRVSGVRRKD